MNAVSTNQGMSATSSIGSQLQYPPQPRIVYAHHAPSKMPTPRMPHMMMAKTRAMSTQSSPYSPEINAPEANANGMVMPTNPDMISGGWL